MNRKWLILIFGLLFGISITAVSIYLPAKQQVATLIESNDTTSTSSDSVNLVSEIHDESASNTIPLIPIGESATRTTSSSTGVEAADIDEMITTSDDADTDTFETATSTITQASTTPQATARPTDSSINTDTGSSTPDITNDSDLTSTDNSSSTTQSKPAISNESGAAIGITNLDPYQINSDEQARNNQLMTRNECLVDEARSRSRVECLRLVR